MSKVDGRFNFSPISVNFLTEIAKVLFAITMLLFQVLFSRSTKCLEMKEEFQVLSGDTVVFYYVEDMEIFEM